MTILHARSEPQFTDLLHRIFAEANGGKQETVVAGVSELVGNRQRRARSVWHI